MRDRLLAAGLVAEAASLMQRATRLHPESRPLHFQLGEVYVTWGKYQKAIELFEEAARLVDHSDSALERKQRALIYAMIAQMNFLLVRFDEAFATLTTALEINPDSVSSRLLLGSLLLRRNKFDEAAAEYRRVISIDPRSAAAHDGLAQVDLALGGYLQAEHDADGALGIDPGLQSSRYVKAMALIREGHDREGQTVLDEYHRREAEHQNAQSKENDIAELDRSSGMLAERRPQAAIELLRQGIRTHPLAAVLYLKLGLIQSRLGLHREAVETFETMVRLKLDDFLVHRQLSREYELLGNLEGAQQQRAIYLQRYDAALQAEAN
jgi:tetratricopeptide (TPR) repeat protein